MKDLLLNPRPVQILSLLVLCRTLLSPPMDLVQLIAQRPPLVVQLVPLLVQRVAFLLDLGHLELELIEPLSDGLELRVVELGGKLLRARLVGLDGVLDGGKGFDGPAGALEGGDLVEGLLLGGDGELTAFDLGVEVPGREEEKEEGKMSELLRARAF
jgi:hypothetical protein